MTQSGGGLEYPEQSWYPRWKVRLIIRFAEFGQFAALQATTPTKPARSLNGLGPRRNALVAKPDPGAPPGVTRYTLQAPGGSTVGGPQAQTKSSDGLTQVLEGVVPRDFKWTRAGPRHGDTLEITIPFLACPIDPRTVRSMAVEFCLGTVTPAQASALYLCLYYIGSSVAGSAGGVFYARGGWPLVAWFAVGLLAVALASTLSLRR